MNECNVYLKFYTAIIEIQCWCLAYTVLKYFRFIVTACGKYIVCESINEMKDTANYCIVHSKLINLLWIIV